MRIIEDLKGKISHVLVNSVSGVNTGYSDKESADYEVINDRIIYGNENVKLIEYEDIKNPNVVNELDYHGGDLRVDNKKMIETNGGYYSNK